MMKDKIFRFAFAITYSSILTGFAMKFFHLQGSDIFTIIGLLATVVFLSIALYEVYASVRIGLAEKMMWTIALTIFNLLGGLLYYFIGRQHLLKNYKVIRP